MVVVLRLLIFADKNIPADDNQFQPFVSKNQETVIELYTLQID